MKKNLRDGDKERWDALVHLCLGIAVLGAVAQFFFSMGLLCRDSDRIAAALIPERPEASALAGAAHPGPTLTNANPPGRMLFPASVGKTRAPFPG